MNDHCYLLQRPSSTRPAPAALAQPRALTSEVPLALAAALVRAEAVAAAAVEAEVVVALQRARRRELGQLKGKAL